MALTVGPVTTDTLFGVPTPAAPDPLSSRRVRPERGLWRLLGPAFVAAIAYVDPGNVATNVSAGARYGYLLVWVLVVANGMAVLIQYLSAKLGLVTGRSLPELLAERLSPWPRRTYWIQAEVVAAATDVAEVVGGAIALNLLLGLPLVWGGVITASVSMVLLAVHSRRGQQPFEFVIIALLAIIATGFVAGLFVADVQWAEAVAGVVPHFAGRETVVLAASMLGATVMPHAIYLHSSLSRDRHFPAVRSDGVRLRDDPMKELVDADDHRRRLPLLLRATKVDVGYSLLIAGSVNIAMLLLAAAALPGASDTDTIAGAHRELSSALGPAVGMIFAVGLLASGLAATSVGAYAGAVIMGGLLHRRVPLLVRRVVTVIPALVILATGVEPTRALVLSQVVLSVGIPFALVPLVRLTASRTLMGRYAASRFVSALAWCVVVLVIALNVMLIAVAATS